jgi:hypothetical protein
MSKPNQLTAGQASLQVVTEIPDINLLQEVLNHVATHGDVTVAADKITYDEADGDLIRPMLAEIGIEVSDPEIASAPASADAPAAPAAAPAAPAAPAVTAAASDTPAAGDAAVSDDQLYDGVETDAGAAGEVTGVLSASANDRHWILIAGGQALARISLANQPKASQIAGFFQEPAYWNTVVASFQKNGVAATLKSLNAEVFTAKAVKPAAGPDVQALVTAAVEKYRKCLSMAFVATQKNLADNCLKAAAFTALDEAGVADPEAVVEAVFAAGDAFLDDLDKQAGEYMDMDESGVTTAALMLAKLQAISASGVRPQIQSQSAADMVARLVAGNMPITTAGVEELPPAAQTGQDTLVDGEAPLSAAAGVSRDQIRASIQPRF